MKIVLAPDKFKGSLTAERAAEIEKAAILAAIPDAEVLCVPLADGGEGTVRALTAAADGQLVTCGVHDPLGRPAEAEMGMAGGTAFLEMAAASGMVLLEKEERDPMKTSTFGTGEMIRAALGRGVEEIIIGIGGSATVDGGCGMAEALGYRFYDRSDNLMSGLDGGSLRRIGRIDASCAAPQIKNCRFRTASDVTNPLLGENGAVAVFAPQKGATPETMPLLEEGLANLRRVLISQGLVSSDLPGDGAAGGLGLGLRAFCGAVPESGAQLAISATKLVEKIRNADFVITGEGCSDDQTDNGKLCAVVAETCRSNGVPCVLLSGKLLGKSFPAFALARGTVPPETPFEEVRPKAKELLFAAALELAAELKERKCHA